MESGLRGFGYMSSHADGEHKRRDVAILLMSLFVEDVQMYGNRNELDMVRIIKTVLEKTSIRPEGHMGYMLDGRTLWFFTSAIECLAANEEDQVSLK